MTKEQFKEYLATGKYNVHKINVALKEGQEAEFVPNQAFSIRELMERQSKGLPMPNLTPTIHTAFNGYDLDNLPVTARRDVDIIDVHKEMVATKQEIADTEAAHRTIKRERLNQLKKNNQSKTEE